MGLTVANGSYWEFLVSIAILGFGVVVTVAPLTATVIDAVPPHETGVASGINNAVASVANLSAIAILGTVALSILDHALTPNLQNPALSEGAKHAIQAARGQVVIEPALSDLQGADKANAELLLKRSRTVSGGSCAAAVASAQNATSEDLFAKLSRSSRGWKLTSCFLIGLDDEKSIFHSLIGCYPVLDRVYCTDSASGQPRPRSFEGVRGRKSK